MHIVRILIMVLKNTNKKFSHLKEMQAVYLVVHFVWLEACIYTDSWKVINGLVTWSELKVNKIGRLVAKDSWGRIGGNYLSEWAQIMKNLCLVYSYQRVSIIEETLVVD